MSSPLKVEPTPLLIFDGDCAFCSRCVQFIKRRVRRHPQIQSWQRSDLVALGLTQEQCETAVQLVDRGSITSAHVAVARVLVYGKKGWALPGSAIL